jgi:hypothetical protein
MTPVALGAAQFNQHPAAFAFLAEAEELVRNMPSP